MERKYCFELIFPHGFETMLSRFLVVSVVLKHFLHDFQRLPSGTKLAFFGTVSAFLFLFLPWFQTEQLHLEESMELSKVLEVSNGFGIFPVFGITSLFFIAGSTLIFVQNFFGTQKVFEISHGKIWLFLGGQSLFILLIALGVFFSEIKNDSTAQMRFGLFISLIAHGFVILGGYLFERNQQQKEHQSSLSPFAQELKHLNIKAEGPITNSNKISFSQTHERQQSILR
jgi:hypothetical protein